MLKSEIAAALHRISGEIDGALYTQERRDTLAAGERVVVGAPLRGGSLVVVISFTRHRNISGSAIDAACRPLRRPIDDDTPRDRPIFVCDDTSLCVALWKNGQEYEHRGSKGGGWRHHDQMQHGQPADLWFTPTHWYPLPDLARDVEAAEGGGA